MFGESTEVPEQRPSSPLNSKKIAPLVRETASVGSGTSAKSECGATGCGVVVLDGGAALAAAGGAGRSFPAARMPGPATSTGTARRIRSGVQKPLAFDAFQPWTGTPLRVAAAALAAPIATAKTAEAHRRAPAPARQTLPHRAFIGRNTTHAYGRDLRSYQFSAAASRRSIASA